MGTITDQIQRLELGGIEIGSLTDWPDSLIEDYLGIGEALLFLAETIEKEAWREVGAAGQPAFQNSWGNNGGGTDETAAFRKDGNTNVYLKGYISGGTTADGTVVFTLPEGYRPNNDIRIAGMFVQGSTENAYQLEIQPDGDVAIYGVSGASPRLSLHTRVDIDN